MEVTCAGSLYAGFLFNKKGMAMKYTLDWKQYAEVARKMVAEGSVLLKNDGAVLPVAEGTKVAVFGRIQFHYYKSGSGSGGMVNTPYVISILDALKEEKLELNKNVLTAYEKWIEEHPYYKGQGWAAEPWSQEEMELDDGLVTQAAEESETAMVIIGRLAGEDQDNSAKEGSYLLTRKERDMLGKVCKAFKKTIVVLNVGNIIDMKWVDEFNPSAVLYAWQGGMEGGHGVADILMGRENPSGRLADTIAGDYTDYPSTAYFDANVSAVTPQEYKELKHTNKLEFIDPDKYVEDIYVGYRYFETAAKDKVKYPFGFGLSYTTFDISSTFSYGGDDEVTITSTVVNTGKVSGKQVVQVYCNPPQGALSKPLRNLVEYGKTRELAPGENETLTFAVNLTKLASFDDGGYTGHKNCYVLEAGEYVFYAGENVREAAEAGRFALGETVVVQELSEALAPAEAFDRMVLKVSGDTVTEQLQAVPVKTVDIDERIRQGRPESRPCSGDKGYKFADVATGKVSIEEYLDQLSDEDLITMSRGEGMSSNKVTPGIAGSYGGVTKRLNEHFGMPIAGLSDGPSGMRMDCGAEAFSLPNGTSIACSYNRELACRLYEFVAKEMRYNKVDSLLGPGINIHRNPLNGRNFEYFSEDPYLTGSMAAAVLRGLHTMKVTGTIKHFAANNREHNRHFVDSVVSARALREIYLKGYQIAVQEGGAYNIMTTYGMINGIYTAGNYDLNTTVLRGEWGFDGIVMTDWWARVNHIRGEKGTIQNTGYMIQAQNDLYEVTADSEANANNDDSMKRLEEGYITRGELLRNARNIISSLLRTPAADRVVYGPDEAEALNKPKSLRPDPIMMPASEYIEGTLPLDISLLNTTGGSLNQFPIRINQKGKYNLNIRMKSDLGELSQTSMNISVNNIPIHTITIHGTEGKWIEKDADFEVFVSIDNYIDLSFAQTGIEIDSISVTKKYNYE